MAGACPYLVVVRLSRDELAALAPHAWQLTGHVRDDDHAGDAIRARLGLPSEKRMERAARDREMARLGTTVPTSAATL
jgi:hypothetical protein